MQAEAPKSERLPHPSEQTTRSEAMDARQRRPVTQTVRVHETSEGLGSNVRRCIGNSKVRCLPPFISCDLFRINDIGRPPQPSRGSQKITAVLDGTLSIEYSPSDVIELEAGNVTSLMVGRGVLRTFRAVTPGKNSPPHPPDPPITSAYATRAMPRTEVTGINLFMDVPEPLKRIDSSHIDLCHTDIEAFSPHAGVEVRIITGSGFGRSAQQMLTATPATILDVTIEPGASVEIPVQSDWNAFVFAVEGKAVIQGEKHSKYDYVEFRRRPAKRREKRREKCAEKPQTVGEEEIDKLASTSAETSTAESNSPDTEGATPDRAEDKSEDRRENKSAEGPQTAETAEAGTTRPSGRRRRRRRPSEAIVEVSVSAQASEKARFFFCAAEPLGQPIYRQGPFVDVSMDGIHQAFDDYAEQKNGFEVRRVWQNGSQLDGAASAANGGDEGEPDTEPYNPCDEGAPSSDGSEYDEDSSDEEVGMNAKATFPNAFPPGKVNPAGQSSEFNDSEPVEEQQKRMVPKRPHSDAASESDSSSSEDAGAEGHDAKRGRAA